MSYEERYRATLLRMALAGYRLEHGKLPDSLTDLVGTYFKNLETLPRDPFSGRQYVYFPQGVPATNSPLEAADLAEARAYRNDVNYLMPGFWSTGPMLRAQRWQGINAQADASVNPNKDEWVVYYSSRYPYELSAQLRTYQALSRGNWYSIGKPSASND